MVSNVRIRQFRCFKDVSVDLSQYNLIAGRNNAGKTASLEAMFTMAGCHTPATVIKLNSFRGISRFKADIEDISRWIFYNGDINNKAIIEFEESDGHKRKLYIDVVYGDKVDMPIGEDVDELDDRSSTSSISSKLLRFKYEDSTDYDFEVFGGIVNGKYDFKTVEMVFPDSVFMSSTKLPDENDVERYSNLEDVGKDQQVVETLRIIEPNLQRLVVSFSGKVPTLKAEIGKHRLVPLSFMGEGLRRLAGIIISIINYSEGLVLIDEIENGLHHSVIEDVWSAIKYVADEYNTQVVATTHSLECIRSAYNAFYKSDAEGFAFHRLDRVNDNTESVKYDIDDLGKSIEMNFEIR